MDTYKFNAGVSCEFTLPAFAEDGFPFIAVYEVDYDGSILIRDIAPANCPPTRIEHAIAEYLGTLDNLDHLEDDIFQSLERKHESDYDDYFCHLNCEFEQGREISFINTYARFYS